MRGTIVESEDLCAITGYERPGDAARCLRQQGIKVFEGRDGRPWTTLDLINLAGKSVAQTAPTDATDLTSLCNGFFASAQFAKLAKATQTDYRYCGRSVCEFVIEPRGALGSIAVSDMTPPMVQSAIDCLALAAPSKAAHVLRFLRRLFKWGVQRGYCTDNPARSVQQPAERKRRRLPSLEELAELTAFAQQRSELQPHSPGACPSYVWAVMEIAYLCRLRGIEVVTLTDANSLEEGVMTNRRKGSRDNIVRWTPRLRRAWDALVSRRDSIWNGRKRPAPIRAEDRPLVVAVDGARLQKSSLDAAWKRLMSLAFKNGVLKPAQRFGLHDLKRRGITDTAGTRAEKQEASGHRAAAMLDVYDLSVPVVDPSVP